jgi:hypothetical protein
MLPAYKPVFWYISISSYVSFVPVSNLLAIFILVWQFEFSPLFSFVTDTKPNFGWRLFIDPKPTKTFYVLVNPKVSGKNFYVIAFIKILLGLPIFQVSLSI